MLLAGCASLNGDHAASLKGACNSFVAPAHVVKGKERRDQIWIDNQIESGVAACNWPRPKADPKPKLAKPKAVKPKAVKVAAVKPAPVVVPKPVEPAPTPPSVVSNEPLPEKLSWWQWLLSKLRFWK